ncbi:MAG: glutamine-hydrolyzing GMP synthase [Nanoarchaeota archaeon]|nr:glutamine-hydrolyzing GMP synthase [Nanoarchaeota archaeon]MBU1004846.1 glutamine-hydrolyzing GMP synthase [Nanoarchaeota archaeon]MBU1946784.1 glutamine-hydrolyzing GMP synthase [Nanoarchaeota archaeon]
MLIVVNFGGQYCHLISRRIRDLGVFSEIVPYDVSVEKIKNLNPQGIILSGGPSSVYGKDAPISDEKILSMGIPVLGICYGQQLIGKQMGGKVVPNSIKEYGKKKIKIVNKNTPFKGLGKEESVWMSHGDAVEELPKGFVTLASTDTCKNAAIGNFEKNIYGVQFHPEVTHTPKGNLILENFVFEICKAKKDFDIKDLAQKIIKEIKEEVKDDHVIMGVSGGVDSTVAATLINLAIGKKLHGVFIDHGLARKYEMEEVKERYDRLGLNMKYVEAADIFLDRLKGVTDPEEKRKIIGKTFIDVFDKEAKLLEKECDKIKFLAQGTIYPDRIESAQPSKQADKIKSHHNVALPKNMKLKVLEPIKDLYKDGVRKLGEQLKIPAELLYRHPFPGPGLAVRILGEVTRERIKVLQDADYIFISELKSKRLYDTVWQAFAALLPVKAVGVMGDARTYENIISLRAVNSVDAMTADWAKLPYEFLEHVSNRIINEVKGVNRVVYDISQKPPATIEYE